MFEDAINEKVEFKTKDGKNVVLSKLAIGLQQLATQFAKGDRYARRDVSAYAIMLGIDLQAKAVIEEALGISDQAIVDEFLRRQQPPTAEADTHVKAPPDLLDDDVAKPDANAPSAASAKSAVPPATKIVPEGNRHGAPRPGGHTRASIEAERAYNLAQQKKNNES